MITFNIFILFINSLLVPEIYYKRRKKYSMDSQVDSRIYIDNKDILEY